MGTDWRYRFLLHPLLVVEILLVRRVVSQVVRQPMHVTITHDLAVGYAMILV